MKIKIPTKGYKIVDIGPLDTFRLVDPVSERVAAMDSFRCSHCRNKIGREQWVIGFKKDTLRGLPHSFIFHLECHDGTGWDVTGEKT